MPDPENLLGGKVFDSANWDDAQRYMEVGKPNDTSLASGWLGPACLAGCC